MVFNPGAGVKKILTKFGKKAFKHWFKHATAKDLIQIKIYDRVREQLEVNFTAPLIMFSNGTALNKVKSSAFVAYEFKSNNSRIRPMAWG